MSVDIKVNLCITVLELALQSCHTFFSGCLSVKTVCGYNFCVPYIKCDSVFTIQVLFDIFPIFIVILILKSLYLLYLLFRLGR